MIAILDYGSGNLRSALRAFETTGRKVLVTSDPDLALKAAGLVVPGVGAFATCMNGLIKVKGDQIIKQRVANNQPIFGICVGMQILFKTGLENGTHDGVGVIDGEVKPLAAPVLPHMGWNTVKVPTTSKLYKGLSERDDSYYFVHSYAVQSAPVQIPAYANYYGDFLAGFEHGCISATQFHPEKSGASGLKLISNWVESL